jgi:leucine dehydrogenase
LRRSTAPCAVGATVNEESIAQLRCRIVAGSANNQLAEEADSDRLAERGILYAPDWVINAGGALAFADLQAGTADTNLLLTTVNEVISAAVTAVLRDAVTDGVTPHEAARRRARRRLGRSAP